MPANGCFLAADERDMIPGEKYHGQRLLQPPSLTRTPRSGRSKAGDSDKTGSSRQVNVYMTFLTDHIPQDEHKALVFSCACAINIPLYVHLIKQHVLKTTNVEVDVIPNMCKVLQSLPTGGGI